MIHAFNSFAASWTGYALIILGVLYLAFLAIEGVVGNEQSEVDEFTEGVGGE